MECITRPRMNNLVRLKGLRRSGKKYEPARETQPYHIYRGYFRWDTLRHHIAKYVSERGGTACPSFSNDDRRTWLRGHFTVTGQKEKRCFLNFFTESDESESNFGYCTLLNHLMSFYFRRLNTKNINLLFIHGFCRTYSIFSLLAYYTLTFSTVIKIKI